MIRIRSSARSVATSLCDVQTQKPAGIRLELFAILLTIAVLLLSDHQPFIPSLTAEANAQQAPLHDTDEVAMPENFVNVASTEELYAALNAALGGETIVLAPGDYGKLELVTTKTTGVKAVYDVPVTITSADSGNLASFSGMNLHAVENLTIESVKLDYTFDAGDLERIRPFEVTESSGIVIKNSFFDGDLTHGTETSADGTGTGFGLFVRDSTDVVIQGNDFSHWLRAAVFLDDENLKVLDNNIHDIRSDGFDFAAVQSVLIEGNHFYDFHADRESGDHRDMIQFWTANTTAPSVDVVIRNNTFDIGEGDETQSIFMRNEVVDRGLVGEEMFYRNILIEENVILNNHLHGITVGETDDLIIRNNSVLEADSSLSGGLWTPKINVAESSVNVTIENNAVAGISGFTGQVSWNLLDNALVQNTDKNAPGYYENEFIRSSMDGDSLDYIVDPDGITAKLSAGASRLQLDTTPDVIRPVFDVSNVLGTENSLVFDAGYTFGPEGPIDESGARFIWDFGDGTGATGLAVRHLYSDAGRYEATLTIVLSDGTTATAQSQIGIRGTDVLSFDAQTGRFLAEGYGTATSIEGSDKASVALNTEQGVDLGGTGTVLSIGQVYLVPLFGAASFEMTMTLQADTVGSIGEVVRVHDNILLAVAEGGAVSLILKTDTESVILTTAGVMVNDGADHDIAIVFDGSTGNLEIHVDGQLAGETEVAGIMRSDYPRDLTFGNPWGKTNFDGTLTAFDLEVGSRDYPDYEGDSTAIPDGSVPVSELPFPGAETDDAALPTDTSDDVQNPSDDGTQDQGALPIEDGTILPDNPLYSLDFALLGTGEEGYLVDDAHVVETHDGKAKLVLDGDKDFVALGRIEALEASQQFSTSVTFQRADVGAGQERLVWNHMKFGVVLDGDDILVHLANTENPFHKALAVRDAGVGDLDEHTLAVTVDAEADRLQVVLDGEVVLDICDVDFDFVGAGGIEWGWSLGTAWNRYYEGSISEFTLDDQAVFVDSVLDVV